MDQFTYLDLLEQCARIFNEGPSRTVLSRVEAFIESMPEPRLAPTDPTPSLTVPCESVDDARERLDQAAEVLAMAGVGFEFTLTTAAGAVARFVW